ncbi:MAG: DegT/DnrJ/EryC1/StrS family aminotransferase [Muribaculaceae bacterium]|nr:DegT/DnrJ/EryC1/StrS family aminotransferase [Muribaculaceae bacterium]
MKDNRIKFADLEAVTQMHGDEIRDAIIRTVDSGWYLHGSETAAFEQEYADYIGTKHTVGVANGLDALTLSLLALRQMGELSEGDEVLVPANTFIASVLAITEAGLTPVLVEPDPETLQIDAAKAAEAITPRTKAMMLVHLYGRCAYNQAIESLVSKHALILIEDNAQAHGCIFEGKRTGSLGRVGCHSFYPGKNLGALGDGGAITTDDDRLAEIVRALGNYGSETKYVCKYRGRNSRLDEMQAAALRVKLRYLDADNERRRRIARIYYDRLSATPGLRLPALTLPQENVYHLFPIFVENRDFVRCKLDEAGVDTLIHYPIPPHRQECYAGYFCNQEYPITDQLATEELSLPIYAAMTESDAHRVADMVLSVRR